MVTVQYEKRKDIGLIVPSCGLGVTYQSMWGFLKQGEVFLG